MTARILRYEIRDELLGILREPTALFFSVLMPVGFFALFTAMFSGQATESPSTAMIVPFGTFGALAVVLMNPGIGLADARERGWLRVKRVSGTPLWVTVVAKVLAATPYAIAVLAAIALASVLIGSMPIDVGQLFRVIAVIVLGAVPFAGFSLAVGAKAGTNASAAILNAILMPSAIASGLWFPHDLLPGAVARIGEFLPTYHLARLAMVQVEGGPWMAHVAVLGATALIGTLVAAMAYRSARP